MLSSRLGIHAIQFTAYGDLGAIKDSARVRNVFFHIVQSPADIKNNETPLFDVFICINAQQLPEDIQAQYLVEQVGQFAVLTK